MQRDQLAQPTPEELAQARLDFRRHWEAALAACAQRQPESCQTLFLFRAQVEALVLRDQPAFRDTMEKCVQQFGSRAESWYAYIELDAAFGAQQVRALCRRGVEYVKDDPENMLRTYVQKEKILGTLRDVEVAEQRLIDFQLKHQAELEELQMQQELAQRA